MWELKVIMKMKLHIVFAVLNLLAVKEVAFGNECVPRSYGKESIVCVCNATYCDSIEEELAPLGSYVQYISSKEGLRFHKEVGQFGNSSDNSIFDIRIKISPTVTYQSVIGFGGAFTDAAGINIMSLSTSTQDNVIRSYYSKSGLDFNIGRVPIAGSDFSTHPYTYDSVVGDTNFTHFNLSEEDFQYKIPLIKKAQQLTKKDLKLFASAWSSPPWSKTNNAITGFGFLKEEYYQYWADYHLRFLDEYLKEGLNFWAVTTGNEPLNGVLPFFVKFNSLGWTPEKHRKWIKENLGPSIKKSQHSDVKILAFDDQRFLLPWWIDILLSDKEAADYVDGIAVHWYWDTIAPPQLLDLTHQHFPQKYIIATEACVGDKPWDSQKVDLGSWSRGESYMSDIIQDMNHWVVGWVDWNLALNLQGGPNWVENFVDAGIIVNATADEFYKQPLHYALGHFSKFVPENSQRIGLEITGISGLEGVAFRRPDKSIALILYNSNDFNAQVLIEDASRGTVSLDIPKRSFHTILYE